MAQPPAVLVIGGSDSGGGAGLVRDVRTLEALGADALCAVTAVTAQTDSAVLTVHAIPAEHVRAQIEAAFAARAIGAVKIGMLFGRSTVQTVAEALGPVPPAPVVLDPVLQASSGGVLLEAVAVETLRARLLPLTTLVTPNIPEAAQLAGVPAKDNPDAACLLDWARRILAQGARSVLIKGGHASGTQARDLLVQSGSDPLWLSAPRRALGRRGTGCALSSAVAAALSAGADVAQACRLARSHVLALLEQAQHEAEHALER